MRNGKPSRKHRWFQWAAFPSAWFLLLILSVVGGAIGRGAHNLVVWLTTWPGIVVWILSIPAFSTLGWWLARLYDRNHDLT